MQPYYDGRYLSPYRDQFSLILDSLIYGKSAARTRQSLPIGKSIMELSSDQKVITTHDLVRRLSVKQLGEKNQKKILKLAIDILTMHNLESALYLWVKNTDFDEVITTPEKFYEQKTGKKAKFTVEESLNNVKKSMTGKIKFEN